MSGRLRIVADPEAVSMAAAIRAAAEAAPLLVLTARALGDLSAELGGPEASALYLAELAHEVGRPIGINVETGRDTSSTLFLPPRTWTQERLSGWAAAKRDELEDAFGEVVRARSSFPTPGAGG